MISLRSEERLVHDFTASSCSNASTGSEDDNCWSQEDDQITAQYQTIRKIKDRDTISQMSIESSDSSRQEPIFFQVGLSRSKKCYFALRFSEDFSALGES